MCDIFLIIKMNTFIFVIFESIEICEELNNSKYHHPE